MTSKVASSEALSSTSVRPKGRVVPTIIAVAVSVLAVLGAASFARKPPEPVPPPAGMHVGEHEIRLEKGAPQWDVLRTGKATRAEQHWTDPVMARVRIDEAHAARVGLPLSGIVTAVYVELGQPVKKGQPLLTVNSADLASLHNDVNQAAVDVEVARTQYARVHDMVAARLMPGKEELAADAQKRQAELRLSAGQSKLQALRIAQVRENEFTITAPRDGVIVDKNVLPAQQVSPDVTLMQIADVSDVWVVADLFEGQAEGVQIGAPVRITLPSLPGFSIDTKIDMVSAVVDPERHSIPVKVHLPNTDGKLRPNQYADMRFLVSLPAAAVEVPTTALVSDGATQYVYVEEPPGTFTRRNVVAGPARDGKVAITEGLREGENVVIAGGILLDNQIEIAH
ncbi:MAG TPA: efflux RND transporter periplasmic adaptor subunit [Polyangiales bacterium]|nr:efflux RND transporter periplasmic adaptor subunit [Polyangiales bacterium]